MKYIKAFTLIEILVSSIIVALVLVGFVNIFVLAKSYVLHNRSRVAGAELGRAFIDPLQMDVRQDNWNNTCLGNNTTACPANQTINDIAYNKTYNITNVTGTSLRRVSVNITWNETTF